MPEGLGPSPEEMGVTSPENDEEVEESSALVDSRTGERLNGEPSERDVAEVDQEVSGSSE